MLVSDSDQAFEQHWLQFVTDYDLSRASDRDIALLFWKRGCVFTVGQMYDLLVELNLVEGNERVRSELERVLAK